MIDDGDMAAAWERHRANVGLLPDHAWSEMAAFKAGWEAANELNNDDPAVHGPIDSLDPVRMVGS